MQQFIDDLLRFYASARGLLDNVNVGPRRGSSSNPFRASALGVLSEAVATGSVELGDYVRVSGWLSPYTYWYLPKAFSPYRFASAYVADGDRMATKMTSVPALLPSGHVPFRRDGKHLGFLYPADTFGFNLELADSSTTPSSSLQIQIAREDELKTVDDQPWFYSLDYGHANYSLSPEAWIYSSGDTELSSRLTLPDGKASRILNDPKRVREVVTVPEQCKPIPILYPDGFPFLNQYVQLTARLIELDASTVAELSRLGAPLATKVFSLFSRPGAVTPPFCLAIEARGPATRRVPEPSDLPFIRPKMMTLLSEFYFEEATTGVPIPFGDDELTDWFLPCIKDQVFTLGRYLFPDRWVGKLFGFEGPIYVYKTGPMELSMSPSGAISAYMHCDINHDMGCNLGLFEDVVMKLRTNMIALYQQQHGKRVRAVNTFMTDTGWQTQLGPLLNGQALDDAVQRHQPYQQMRRQLQETRVDDKSALVAPVRARFIAPVTEDVSDIVSLFDQLRHNIDLLPLNGHIFNRLMLPNWSLHDPKDSGTDHLVYASINSKATVSVQIKSHKEIVEESDFYDTVLSQRAQSSAYSADLYLILLYGNSLSKVKRQGQRQAKLTEGQTVAARFAELKRKIEKSEFRGNTEVIPPENIAQLVRQLGIRLVDQDGSLESDEQD